MDLEVDEKKCLSNKMLNEIVKFMRDHQIYTYGMSSLMEHREPSNAFEYLLKMRFEKRFVQKNQWQSGTVRRVNGPKCCCDLTVSNNGTMITLRNDKTTAEDPPCLHLFSGEHLELRQMYYYEIKLIEKNVPEDTMVYGFSNFENYTNLLYCWVSFKEKEEKEEHWNHHENMIFHAHRPQVRMGDIFGCGLFMGPPTSLPPSFRNQQDEKSTSAVASQQQDDDEGIKMAMMTLFFTYNGHMFASKQTEADMLDMSKLCPKVLLRENCTVEANFGQELFQFSISGRQPQ